MPLQKQNMSISFAKGIDTKTDPKQVIAGDLLTLENATFQNTNEFRKRNGFSPVATNTTLTQGNALSSYNSELAAMDGLFLYSLSEEQNSLTNKGTKVAVDLSIQSITQNSYEQTNPDSGFHSSGISAFAYEQSNSGGLRYSVLDTVTGQSIINNQQVSSTGVSPKVGVVGNFLVIFYLEANILTYRAINIATPTSLGAPVSLTTTQFSAYDVKAFNSRLYVVYPDAFSQTSILFLSSTLVASTPFQVNVVSLIVCVFNDASNNSWVAYQDNFNNVKYFIVNPNLSSLVLAPTLIEALSSTVQNITGAFSLGIAPIFYELSQGLEQDAYVRVATVDLVGSPPIAGDFLRSVGLWAKAFVFNTRVYVGLVHDSPLQSTYFIATAGQHIVAKLAPSNSGGLTTDKLLTEVNLTSTGVFKVSYLVKDLLSSVSGAVYTQTGVNQATLTFNVPFSTDVLGANLEVSGGIVSMYDGAQVVEQGFNYFPEGPGKDGAIGFQYIPAGGSLAPGSYSYAPTYEWTDNKGQIHRSAPNPGSPLDVVTDGYTMITGDITNASPDITNVDFTRVGTLYLGMLVTSGALFPAGTKIISFDPAGTKITVDNNATAGLSGASIKFTGQYIRTASFDTGSDSLRIGPPGVIYTSGLYDGTTTLTVYNTDGLYVGQTIYVASQTSSSGATIVSINGNSVVVSGSLGAVGGLVTFGVEIITTATFTAASGVITGIPANIYNNLFVGQLLTSPGAGITTSTISTLNGAGSITVTPFAANSGSFSVNFYFNQNAGLRVGQLISGAGLQANTTITALSSGLFSGQIVTVDLTTTLTESNVAVIITNVYSAVGQLPTLRLTEKGSNSPVSIVVYRTLKNGTQYFRVSSITDPVINLTSVDYIEFYDLISDYEAEGNQQLYTNGGELENIAPPAFSHLNQYKSRLIGIMDEDPLSFWYSKQIIQGAPVEFNDSLVQRVEERGGNLVVSTAMDDKLLLFKKNNIFYMFGDGPTANGLNNNFSSPQLITTDTGCDNKRSVVNTPMGVMFHSPKGIYLIDRSLTVKYIGAPVEAYNNDTITSAKLIEGVNQVRFSLASGVLLVYDYYFNQWSVFTAQNAADSAIFQNKYTYIKPTGALIQETPGVFNDNLAFIAIKIGMSWLSFAGLQAYQRAYKLLVLGEWISAHSLKFDMSYDFDNTVFQTVTIPSPSSIVPYQYRVFFTRQKCEAVKITITELQSGPTYGEGLSLSAIGLEVGVKKGLDKVSAAVSYG